MGISAVDIPHGEPYLTWFGHIEITLDDGQMFRYVVTGSNVKEWSEAAYSMQKRALREAENGDTI